MVNTADHDDTIGCKDQAQDIWELLCFEFVVSCALVWGILAKALERQRDQFARGKGEKSCDTRKSV